jgi:hypothetical protein
MVHSFSDLWNSLRIVGVRPFKNKWYNLALKLSRHHSLFVLSLFQQGETFYYLFNLIICYSPIYLYPIILILLVYTCPGICPFRLDFPIC